jgi:hypothetical protein
MLLIRIGKIVFLGYVVLTFWAAMFAAYGCGTEPRTPDYKSAQGLNVYDPHGFSNAQEVTLLIDCFEFYTVPDYPTIDYTHLHMQFIPTEDVDECGTIPGLEPERIGGCTFRGDFAYVRWRDGLGNNSAAHELLHLVDDNGECRHTGDPETECARWQRIRNVKNCFMLGDHDAK